MPKDDYPKPGAHTPEAKAQREAHWRQILERWRASGLRKTDFARREQISADVLGWWQAEIRKRDLARRRKSSARTAARTRWSPRAPRPAAFVPVRVVEAAPPPSPAAIEVLAGGRTVRVRPGFDAETLKRLVATLEDRP